MMTVKLVSMASNITIRETKNSGIIGLIERNMAFNPIWIEKIDYSGFHTRPWGWNEVTRKFHGLAGAMKASKRDQLVDMVQHLEKYSARELMSLLSKLD